MTYGTSVKFKVGTTEANKVRVGMWGGRDGEPEGEIVAMELTPNQCIALANKLFTYGMQLKSEIDNGSGGQDDTDRGPGGERAATGREQGVAAVDEGAGRADG